MKYTILIILSILIFGCNSSQKNMTAKPFDDNLPAFDKEAHRGGRGLMPENTIPAMINVLGLGVTTLEMDVVFTKDKKIILSHEPFFNHELTTKPDGKYIDVTKEKDFNIYNMTYDEVQTYDVGLKPHPRFRKQQKMAVTKPLLSDVFQAVKDYMMMARRPPLFYNIETKTTPETDGTYHPAPEEFIEKLMAVIDEADMRSQVIIQSFDFRTLQYLHKKYPKVKTAMLVEKTDKRSFRKQLDDLGFEPTIYSPEFGIVTEKLVAEAHQKGIRIIPWTVNTAAEIARLKGLGVDGLISDYPDLL